MDEFHTEIRIAFTLIAMGNSEASNRMQVVRSWLMKGAAYLERRGWLEQPTIVVKEPVKTGERKLADYITD